jgi:hypothetical protein
MKTSNRIKLRERMTHGAQLNSTFHRMLTSRIVNMACRLQPDGARAKKPGMNKVSRSGRF